MDEELKQRVVADILKMENRYNPRPISNPARFILGKSGYRLSMNRKLILSYHQGRDDPPSPDAWVQDFRFPLALKSGQDIVEIPYEKLQRFGLNIVSVKVHGKASALKNLYGVNKLYYLTNISNPPYPLVYELPRDLVIQYHVANRTVRLKGMNCMSDGGQAMGNTDWVSLVRQKHKDPKLYGNPARDEDVYFAKLLGEKTHETIRYIQLPNSSLPKLITPDNELLCIPRGRDMHTFGTVGQKRKGKSYSIGSEIEQITTRWNLRIGIVNDILDETRGWAKKSSPYPTSEMETFGLKPMGLPLVYLYQNTKHLMNSMIAYKGDLGFRTSLSTSDVIEHFETFQDLFDLPKASLNYLRKFTNEISQIGDVNMLRDFLGENLPGNNRDAKENIISAIARVMQYLYQEQLLDSSTGIPSQWVVRDPQGNIGHYPPFLACLMVHSPIGGLIPSNVNFHFLDAPYMKNVFNKSAGPVFEMHRNNPSFRNPGTILYCDEITKIASKSSYDKASEILGAIVAQGGPVNLGLHWATNFPKDVPEVIYSNTAYYFVFSSLESDAKIAISRYKGTTKAKALARMVTGANIPKHHCMALTTEKFILYDTNGTHTEIGEGEPVIGRALPRISMHRKPSSEGGE